MGMAALMMVANWRVKITKAWGFTLALDLNIPLEEGVFSLFKLIVIGI